MKKYGLTVWNIGAFIAGIICIIFFSYLITGSYEPAKWILIVLVIVAIIANYSIQKNLTKKANTELKELDRQYNANEITKIHYDAECKRIAKQYNVKVEQNVEQNK